MYDWSREETETPYEKQSKAHIYVITKYLTYYVIIKNQNGV
jgi:hypothetical protein